MLAKRMLALLCLSVICICPQVGCAPKEEGVDAPLNKNAGPPPPRPNKPEVTPSGGGGVK